MPKCGLHLHISFIRDIDLPGQLNYRWKSLCTLWGAWE